MLETNFDLFFSLIGGALTLFLGILVLIHNRQGATNKIFIIHSFIGAVWALATYFSIIVDSSAALFWIRNVIFFAVPHVILFYIFVRTFPSPKFTISGRKIFAILSVMTAMMVSTQTNWIFRDIRTVDGAAVVPVPGPLIPVFAFVLIAFFVTTVILVIKKYSHSNSKIRSQWTSIGAGMLIAYSLLIFLVFVRVIVFDDTTFVTYSPLFILPIFVGAAIAILRHKLFDVKIITAEILTFVLMLAGFTQVLLAETVLSRILAVLGVGFILIVGIVLIKSVLVEVEQREELEVLSSKLKDANYKLKDLDRARAEFINIASHQLRTPPATIKWYLSAILSGDFGVLDPELKDALTKTQLTNNELMSLIEDMLNASRIERGTMEFEFTKVDMLKVVEAGVIELNPQAIAKNLSLNFTKPKSEIQEVTADREKIAQVVNNFIDNAIKYTKIGSVNVSLEADKKYVTVRVKDTGKGINREGLDQTFEKYKRGADSSKYSSGLGLGLYVAKIIVEQHHGKIWAESEGEGKGSTFSFRLPIQSDITEQTTSLDLKQAK